MKRLSGCLNWDQEAIVRKIHEFFGLKVFWIDGSGRFVSQLLCKNLTICLENFKNITIRKVNVVPRKESGRTIAAFADCFHFSGCKGVVEVDSCRTSGSHDDPMNVHGTHLKITGIEDNKLTLHFMHHQTYGFKAFFAGDSVAFVRPENLLIQGDYCRWIYPAES